MSNSLAYRRTHFYYHGIMLGDLVKSSNQFNGIAKVTAYALLNNNLVFVKVNGQTKSVDTNDLIIVKKVEDLEKASA